MTGIDPFLTESTSQIVDDIPDQGRPVLIRHFPKCAKKSIFTISFAPSLKKFCYPVNVNLHGEDCLPVCWELGVILVFVTVWRK